jgi:D-sedoheptulose 7-phosphate isomerase
MDRWPREPFYETMQLVFEETVRLKQGVLESQRDCIVDMALCLTEALKSGHKLFLFGNGGSAADAQHMAAELVNRFQLDRPPLAAIALTVDTSVLTSIGNDFSFDAIFLKQLQALAAPGDVALGISTSGRSQNVLKALEWGRENRLRIIAWAGKQHTEMDELCELILHVPSEVTARIQEVHIMVGHLLCQFVEQILYGRGVTG